MRATYHDDKVNCPVDLGGCQQLSDGVTHQSVQPSPAHHHQHIVLRICGIPDLHGAGLLMNILYVMSCSLAQCNSLRCLSSYISIKQGRSTDVAYKSGSPVYLRRRKNAIAQMTRQRNKYYMLCTSCGFSSCTLYHCVSTSEVLLHLLNHTASIDSARPVLVWIIV